MAKYLILYRSDATAQERMDEAGMENMKDHPNFSRGDMSMELLEYVTMPGM